MELKKKFSGIAEGVISMKKRIWFTVILIVALFSAVLFYAFYSFGHSGLDRALVGLVEGDGYSSWDHWNKIEKTSTLEYDIVSKSRLYISKIFLMERADHYQIRFRIGYGIPFMHQGLLNDIYWILEDGNGNSYTGNMVVYEERIACFNCVNVTLVLDNEIMDLSGEVLNITAVCSKGADAGAENEYSSAHCQTRLFIP